MKTRKLVGTAMLGAAFAVAGAGTASADTPGPALPGPLGQLTAPLESVTGSQLASNNGTPAGAAETQQMPNLGQLGALTSVVPLAGLPI
ncbi:hypothetical protein [Streptomyces sp. MAR4 CNX-425]|uniref:hypothetical protein n=1 Tax=Streptomyces sp. MAR4 CNX-425 TaxID=3406343 RepID=UPI003B514DCD